MMLNYMKGEAFRIVRGKEVYLLAGILSLLAIAANAIEFAMTFVDPGFPYATVRFNLGIVTSSLGSLFFVAGMLVWFLYSEDKKNGTMKNALSHGCSRTSVFAAQCVVSSLAGLACMVVVLAAYVSSAVLLLEGPALPPVVDLLSGVAVALPSVFASVVLMSAVLAHCKTTSSALVAWVVVPVRHSLHAADGRTSLRARRHRGQLASAELLRHRGAGEHVRFVLAVERPGRSCEVPDRRICRFGSVHGCGRVARPQDRAVGRGGGGARAVNRRFGLRACRGSVVRRALPSAQAVASTG